MARQQSAAPQGTFTKMTRSFTVTFHEQEQGVKIPTYAKNALIKGEVELHDPQDVIMVTVKVSKLFQKAAYMR